MIAADDLEFHAVPDADRLTWAETNYFPFFIPASGLSGAIYNVFRPGLGVCMSDVTIFDRCARHWEGLAYTDNQQHIPAPPSLVRYALRNGVRVEASPTSHAYRIDYIGIDDTEVHFDFRSLMRPQDFNDPAHDPLAKTSSTGAWDKAFNGHFDMTGRATGELVLRGERFDIDCMATMDHSWGPRLERNNGSATFVQAHFDEDLSINALLALNPEAMDVSGPLLHGYSMQGGRVTALLRGGASITREGLFPTALRVSAEDQAGRTYEMEGRFVSWAPWAPYSSILYYQGMTHWRMHDRDGYGAYQEVLSRAAICRHKLSD